MFSTHNISLSQIPHLSSCASCKSWFTQNILDSETASHLYATGSSDSKWVRNLKFEESKSKNITQRLELYLRQDVNLLDIGCNTGELLDFARSRGCVTAGVELSETSQNILKDKGHYFFGSLDAVEGQYDVITAFDVVEHLYDVPIFLDRVESLLSKGGVFIFLTGDIKSLSARLSVQRWWYLKAPEHIGFPSIDFFKNLKEWVVKSVDKTYASAGYRKLFIWGLAQFLRKTFFKGGYDGLSSLGPDHMLVVMEKKTNIL